ncbi:hypothetical protein F5X68DRAFT_208493 [Plectosphaerella plurivora]|uniref:ASX DEUBAD domain-containing protein n=1 Tax=Plectosphaerella plurivora TaxID=936078 RepID=A0A9P9A7W9_9PEZI|nr:hypothetical protein F5X68DRAFT_208493 [Plectosphaerella plurivora]
MLCTSEAWDVLPIQDKADIIALMPQTIPVVPRTATSDSRPDALFLANSDNFNFDCGQYVDHLRNGQHDPRWILEAMDAHDQHNNGDFDSLIQEKFTHDWEEEWPTESKDGEDQEGEDGEGGEEVVNGEEGEQSDTNA